MGVERLVMLCVNFLLKIVCFVRGLLIYVLIRFWLGRLGGIFILYMFSKVGNKLMLLISVL